MLKFSVYGSIFASFAASVVAVLGFYAAKSAPQEAAVAALALCIAVIPYTFMRTIQIGVQMDNEEARHAEIMAALKKQSDRL